MSVIVEREALDDVSLSVDVTGGIAGLRAQIHTALRLPLPPRAYALCHGDMALVDGESLEEAGILGLGERIDVVITEKCAALEVLRRAGVTCITRWDRLARAVRMRDADTLRWMRLAWGTWALYELLPSDEVYDEASDDDLDVDARNEDDVGPSASSDDDDIDDGSAHELIVDSEEAEEKAMECTARVKLLVDAGYDPATLADIVFACVLDYEELYDAAVYLLRAHPASVAERDVLDTLCAFRDGGEGDGACVLQRATGLLPQLHALTAPADGASRRPFDPRAHRPLLQLIAALVRHAASLNTPATARTLSACRAAAAAAKIAPFDDIAAMLVACDIRMEEPAMCL